MLGWIIWVQASRGNLDIDSSSQKLSEWFEVGPWPTLDECQKALAFQADAFELIVKKRDPDARRHGAALLSHDNEYLYVHEFMCFPDTVDPRKSKR